MLPQLFLLLILPLVSVCLPAPVPTVLPYVDVTTRAYYYTLGGFNGDSSSNILREPQGIFSNYGSGELYIADSINARVLAFPQLLNLQDVWNSAIREKPIKYNASSIWVFGQDSISSADHTVLTTPFGIAVDPNTQKLFVTDQVSSDIISFDLPTKADYAQAAINAPGATSTPSSIIGRFNSSDWSPLWQPTGLVFNPANNELYVADLDNNRVLEYRTNASSSSVPTDIWGQTSGATRGPKQTCFNETEVTCIRYPTAVTVDAFGGLWVNEYLKPRILYFPKGSKVATKSWTTNAQRPQEWNSIWSMNFDASGSFLSISCGGAGLVYVLSFNFLAEDNPVLEDLVILGSGLSQGKKCTVDNLNTDCTGTVIYSNWDNSFQTWKQPKQANPYPALWIADLTKNQVSLTFPFGVPPVLVNPTPTVSPSVPARSYVVGEYVVHRPGSSAASRGATNYLQSFISVFC